VGKATEALDDRLVAQRVIVLLVAERTLLNLASRASGVASRNLSAADSVVEGP